MDDVVVYGSSTVLPTIHVISDSVGLTAQAVARAAAAQFGVTNPAIEVLPKVRTLEDIKAFIDKHSAACGHDKGNARMLVFYTLVDRDLSRRFAAYVREHDNIVAVDLVTDAIAAITNMTGMQPSTKPGGLHVADQHYFKRIEALEFSIAHDDGRNPQDLTHADIVLLGVSRSSKTPTSIYLAQQGYKVANIPLEPSIAPPQELFQVERTRLFGLMTTADILVNIRQRRLGRTGYVAKHYADPEFVYQDLENAHALMRKLGCIVIHTENRAVEETAQEILRYYEQVYPSSSDVTDWFYR